VRWPATVAAAVATSSMRTGQVKVRFKVAAPITSHDKQQQQQQQHKGGTVGGPDRRA